MCLNISEYYTAISNSVILAPVSNVYDFVESVKLVVHYICTIVKYVYNKSIPTLWS